MPDPVGILLVEDHAFTRDGLRATLNLEPDLRVVAEARSGEEALEVLTGRPVDVAVVDIGLPGMDGIATAREIKRRWPGVRIVMLTAHDLREEVFASLASGADAYCLKSASPDLLLLAIRAAAAGSAYLDPRVAHHVLGGVRMPEAHSPLTPRELDILRLIADGLPNKDIAEALGVSVSTVKLHIQDILHRLQAADRTQAAVKALRAGLL
ncbi:response regulator [Deinococcus radiodurans]|uniref:response regulator n=3 Tax=Deinococcus radiodurans TaxID=1299 RepID=UPI00140FCB18|nr:response regulator transcription factor [Deinococcus radiodurans]QIP30656.1 response regulator transcription factor [Deinococcus radiodurans]QIP33535.1 response regulator transcription factor [Deinococcus radiodurans]UDL02208.1 response regulator transcription factor [Deinococcus radiodurans R1 = ATCC 13939 = DSM 20539]UID72020.1 DNA-binding response regulator [Deinococcus radiodurans R1 = ATCC 13939 = DSM 20539]